MILEYLEFCAGRSVAVTDIEEQCDWFITRVYQIKESLKKLKRVAIGMLAAIIVLYIPFIMLQWESITENVLTLLTALLSFALPLILLYIIFGILSIAQRKKYRKAWVEFKKKSDQALENNAISAEKYDRLLTVAIPALRWVYEYKLDVEFYADCCKNAKAKLQHHSKQLHDRVETIGNIVEDLQEETVGVSKASERDKSGDHDEIDYNVSFCTGKKNRDFYSVVDAAFLSAIQKKEEAGN